MLATKYENLYYEQHQGAIHHYIRFMKNGKSFKRKVSVGLSHKEANKIALNMREDIEKNYTNVQNETIEVLYHKMLNQKKHFMYTRFEKNSNSLFKNLNIIATRTIHSLSISDLQALINERLQNKLSPSSVYQLKRLLIDIYSVSSSENIARKLEIPKFDNTVYFDIHIDDARRLYKAILDYPDLVYRSIFLFGIQGRRKGEIAYLKWSDLDLKNQRYFIRPENNKARRLVSYSLMDEQIKILEQLSHEKDFIHINENGKPLYYFQKRWKKLLKDNLIDDMRFHDLRHMLGCLAINEGFSEEYIAKALGHTSTVMVKRYSRLKDSCATMVTTSIHNILIGG